MAFGPGISPVIMRSTQSFAFLALVLAALAGGWVLYGVEGQGGAGGVSVDPAAEGLAPQRGAVDVASDVESLPGVQSQVDPAKRVEASAVEPVDGALAQDQTAEGDVTSARHTLKFVVTDAAGAALPECPIWVVSLEGRGDELADDLMTNSRGEAQILLSAGKYMFGVNGGSGGAPGESALAGLSMGFGDLQLTGDAERRVMLQRLSASVRVEVVDDLGNPVQGVEVVVVGGRERRANTGADGLVLLDELLPGEVHVRILGDSTLGVAIPQRSVRSIAVGANRTAETRMDVARLGSALLTLEAPQGAATGEADTLESLVQVNVSLYPVDPLYVSSPAQAFVTQAKAVPIPALAPGSYRVQASFPAGSAWTLASELPLLEIKPGEASSLVLRTIEPGEGLYGIILERSGESAALVPLAVFLLDADGRPVAGKAKSARTDSDGRFSIQGLAAGTYGVTISVQQAADENYAWPDTSAGPFETFIVPCPELRLTVDPGARILGTVLGAEKAGSLSLEVDRYRSDSPQAFEVKDGRVEIRHLRPGTYRLRWLNRASEAVHEESVTVAEGADVEVTLDRR